MDAGGHARAAAGVAWDMTSQVVQYRRYGGPEVLELVEREDPTPGPGQVRLAVRAAAVNPLDWKLRGGGMASGDAPDGPRVPGFDVAGVVDAVGEGVTANSGGRRGARQGDRRLVRREGAGEHDGDRAQARRGVVGGRRGPADRRDHRVPRAGPARPRRGRPHRHHAGGRRRVRRRRRAHRAGGRGARGDRDRHRERVPPGRRARARRDARGLRRGARRPRARRGTPGRRPRVRHRGQGLAARPRRADRRPRPDDHDRRLRRRPGARRDVHLRRRPGQPRPAP